LDTITPRAASYPNINPAMAIAIIRRGAKENNV